MPRGDKSKYTGKQKRKAKHIEEGLSACFYIEPKIGLALKSPS
jgi:hypothetical protein